MAYIQMSIMSKSLMRTVPVNVILPADKLPVPGKPERGDKPFKTLYLLHGVFGSYIDWVNGTRIQRYAEDNDLAVVMPSGDNAFYVDQPAAHNMYGEFIGEELPELTRKMFPLSREREDTFIGGLSMGGYGAMRNGLKYSDTFGRIVSLSGALLIEKMAERTPESDKKFFLSSRAYAQACFGDLDKLTQSDMDPKVLIRRLHEEGRSIPKIFIACGESDSLLPQNEEMADYLRQYGADVTYRTGPGAHEWDFWDRWIGKAITEWLPIEGREAGISSGNVGI